MVTLVFVSSEVKEEGDVLEFDYFAIFSSSCAEIVGQTLVLFMIHRTGRTHITALDVFARWDQRLWTLLCSSRLAHAARSTDCPVFCGSRLRDGRK